MKNLFLILTLFISVNVLSQYTPLVPTLYGVHQLRDKVDSARHIPHKTTLSTNTNDTTPQIFAIGPSLWYYADNQFFKVGAGVGTGSGDTANKTITSGLTFSFKAHSNDEWDSISGPATGDLDYIPKLVLNGDSALKNRGVSLLIRNNLPIIKGVDYFFNSTVGKITFVQPIVDDETFQVVYSGDPARVDVEDTSAVIVDTSTFATKFGIFFTSTEISQDQKIQLMDSFGVDYIRTSVKLDSWDGSDAFLDKIIAAGGGKKVILTIDWRTVQNDANGNNIPNPYLQSSEYSSFDTKANQVLTKYASIIALVVFGNEPTNDRYYYGTILDYLSALQHFTSIVHSYGLLITDGCIHVELVNKVIAGGTLDANSKQVDTILTHYPSIDIDYTNIHTHGPNATTYPYNLTTVVNYIKSRNGGKDVVCNEYHVDAAYPSLLQDIIAKSKAAGIQISIAIDAGSKSSGTVSFHNVGTTILNALGNVYKNAIILP